MTSKNTEDQIQHDANLASKLVPVKQQAGVSLIPDYEDASLRFRDAYKNYSEYKEVCAKETIAMFEALKVAGYANKAAINKIAADHEDLRGFSKASIYRNLPPEVKDQKKSLAGSLSHKMTPSVLKKPEFENKTEEKFKKLSNNEFAIRTDASDKEIGAGIRESLQGSAEEDTPEEEDIEEEEEPEQEEDFDQYDEVTLRKTILPRLVNRIKELEKRPMGQDALYGSFELKLKKIRHSITEALKKDNQGLRKGLQELLETLSIKFLPTTVESQLEIVQSVQPEEWLLEK